MPGSSSRVPFDPTFELQRRVRELEEQNRSLAAQVAAAERRTQWSGDHGGEGGDRDSRSQQELAEALAFRDRVLGILGHDLRNPLSAITALATVTMKQEDLPFGVRERLVQVDRAAKRSLAMIETLLDFSESRWTGALTMRPTLVEPAEIAARVIEELRAAHPDRSIALERVGHGGCELDPVRIEQVLSNLVGNAVVHGARHSAIAVVVEVNEAEVVLAVHNRGPVIPAEQIPSLFEPFMQAAPSAVQANIPLPAGGIRSRGLGLGLYIVRHIVDAHLGTIAVESTAEEGTTFRVRLPRLRPVASRGEARVGAPAGR
jgi:signal transduction histidine kinase